jgi:hypothetical protein
VQGTELSVEEEDEEKDSLVRPIDSRWNILALSQRAQGLGLLKNGDSSSKFLHPAQRQEHFTGVVRANALDFLRMHRRTDGDHGRLDNAHPKMFGPS